MLDFARVAESAAAANGRLDKVALIAEYLKTLDDGDLAAAARFFTGNAFAARDQRNLNLGGRTIVAVAQRVWGFDDAALSASYRSTGDLGAALRPLVREPVALELFTSDKLTPSVLLERFGEIAAAGGKNAGKKREVVLAEILRSCVNGTEAAFVVKIITGDLRIGFREGMIYDAIATAFGRTFDSVHRAAMACGDVGEVAVAARAGMLDHITVAFGGPIGFMLASPIPYGDTYSDLDGEKWITEAKYDGIRLQAHVHDGRVQLFSRNLNEVSRSYPEIVEALGHQSRRLILDGEIVAIKEGGVQPFRVLQARLQRKEIGPQLIAEVPLGYFIFDVLAIDEDFLIDEPLLERKRRLAGAIVPDERLHVAHYEPLAVSPEEINRRFMLSRDARHEGLMLKRADSRYAPGRRGKYWLKLKRELATLDVVVVAVEWGHGKRSQVLSDYTFAVRGEDSALPAIGKAYSGLTDAEISELTPWFLEHRLSKEQQRPKARSHEIPVEPKIVLEVAFDIIQESELHESGFSLRFPRIVRIRDDKPPSEIDTLARVREVYEEMRQREGLRMRD